MVTGGTRAQSATPFGVFLRQVGVEHAATRSRVPPKPLSREQWRRLRKAVTPHEGKSLRGLIYRSCNENGLPNTWALLKWAGLSHRNRVIVAEDANIAVAELAHAIRVSDKDVINGRYQDLGRMHRSFFGLDVHASAIETRTRRFSPAAFRADEIKAAQGLRDSEAANDNGAFHRASWELRDIPFCLEHWDMLEDTCWCEAHGVVQGWTRTETRIDECDRCGEPLSEFNSFFIPKDMRPALSILRALVDPSATIRRDAAIGLPEILRNADRSTMFGLIVRMARAISPDAADHPKEDPRKRLNGLWQACDRITRWPYGIESFPWAANHSANSVLSISNAWAGLLGADTTTWRAHRSSQSKSVQTVGIFPATYLAKSNREVVLWAYHSNLLTQHNRMHGSRMLPAFDPEEITKFGQVWRDRIDTQTLAHEFDMPHYGVEQLVAIGLLRADAPAMPGTGCYFSPESVKSFLEVIEAAAVDLKDLGHSAGISVPKASDAEGGKAPTRGASIVLADAMGRITGRPKPIGPVIKLLLDKTIPFAIQHGDHLSGSIVIPFEHLDTVTSLNFCRSNFSGFDFANRMTRRDALDMLNIRGRRSALLDGLETNGVNPKTYSVEDVEKLAKNFVTLSEIAMRLNMTVQVAYSHLHKLDKFEVTPGGWDRKVIIELFRTI